MTTILKIENLSKNFGGLSALTNISLDAEDGQIVGIIGPNGAGKTTLFNCLTGLYYPSEGRILFKDRPIVPSLSKEKAVVVKKIAHISLLLSLFWVFVFWAFLFPMTLYKVELILLSLFLLSLRYLVSQGLKKLVLWAWSVMLVFLIADRILAMWLMIHPTSLGSIPGTSIPFAFPALMWSAISIIFSLYTFWQLISRPVRELFGFRLGPDAICNLGISRTFQNIRLFVNLSVLDNVKIGSHVRLNSGLVSTLLRNSFFREEEKALEHQVIEHLNFVGLGDRFHYLAGAMAYGDQRRLEIARALASNPRIILLDEPAAGMNRQESVRLIELIRQIRNRGITVLIIEHDMKVMMSLADIIYVMDHGEMIARGTPDEIKTNPKVIEAYLGGSHTKC